MVDAATARALHRRLEPLHGMIYFAAEATEAYAALGLRGRDGYFASRAAAMGAVGPEVVIATFFNFQPRLVRHALPAAWATTTPQAVLDARLSAADAALRRMLGDLVDDPELVEVAGLARTAAEACRPEGRPLFAAHAGLPWPAQPHLVLFHAVTLLREHRGDGHIAALVLEGFDNGDALVTHAAELAMPEVALQQTRGFDDAEWAAAKDRARRRGWLTDDDVPTLTPEGAAVRQRVEALTDDAALGPWRALGADGCARLLEVARPLTRAVLKSGVFGVPPA